MNDSRLKKQLLNLYVTAFPEDGVPFANDFITRFYKNNCRYIALDGKAVSMLFLFDCKISADGREYPALYLYAAATLPDYRNCGLMKRLIGDAVKEAEQKGCFLITKPATEDLFDFYASCGFKTAFYYDEKTVALFNNNASLCANKITPSKYVECRERLLCKTPHVTLTETAEYALSGLALFAEDGFCAAVDFSDGRPKVKEFVSNGTVVESTLSGLIGCGEAVVRTCELKRPFAMLYNRNTDVLPPKMYFGIAMD